MLLFYCKFRPKGTRRLTLVVSTNQFLHSFVATMYILLIFFTALFMFYVFKVVTMHAFNIHISKTIWPTFSCQKSGLPNLFLLGTWYQPISPWYKPSAINNEFFNVQYNIQFFFIVSRVLQNYRVSDGFPYDESQAKRFSVSLKDHYKWRFRAGFIVSEENVSFYSSTQQLFNFLSQIYMSWWICPRHSACF